MMATGDLPVEAVRLFMRRRDGEKLHAAERQQFNRLLGIQVWHDGDALDPGDDSFLDGPAPAWLTKLPGRLAGWKYVAGLRQRLLKAVAR